MGKVERAEQSLAADPIDLSALSKRIDCFFERLQTLDNGFKSRWFALRQTSPGREAAAPSTHRAIDTSCAAHTGTSGSLIQARASR
jgi:hypothetical protein